MMKYVFLLSLAPFLFSCPLLAQEKHHHTEPLEKIGKVSFPITCDQSVQKEFERGLALLHSFWYEEAQKSFKEVLDQDPHCAIAYWGQAMSIYRPLWNRPSASDLQNGRSSFKWRKPLMAIHNGSAITLMPSQSSTATIIATIKNAQQIIAM